MSSDNAITRGLRFLEKEQLVNGQFPMEYRALDKLDSATGELHTVPESSPFASCLIALALRSCTRPEARAMEGQIVTFLESESVFGGLWRYWCKDAPLNHQVPFDLDDTACISTLLREVRGRAPDNSDLLLANRNDRGLFYTWMTPRLRRSTFRWWKVVLRDATWGRAVTFWRSGAARGDVDAVVNANVLLYLGEREETQTVIRWLLEVARARQEDATDKWYRSVPAFYYALSRCVANGIESVRSAGAHLDSRYSPMTSADGRIGGDALQTAMAVSSLVNFAFPLATYAHSISYLLDAQSEDGGWGSFPVYYDGRSDPRIAWSSRSLTTALCIEALALHEAALEA